MPGDSDERLLSMPSKLMCRVPAFSDANDIVPATATRRVQACSRRRDGVVGTQRPLEKRPLVTRVKPRVIDDFSESAKEIVVPTGATREKWAMLVP